jgi:hypothetical protein
MSRGGGGDKEETIFPKQVTLTSSDLLYPHQNSYTLPFMNPQFRHMRSDYMNLLVLYTCNKKFHLPLLTVNLDSFL